MKIKVICGFPGIGKSYLASSKEYHDSDSSKFSWIEKGVRNPDWPNNYIEHIKSLEGFIFVSTHKDVRDALYKNDVPFLLVYPDRSLKDEYKQRYIQRGSPESFIKLLDEKWDEWINEMVNEDRCLMQFVLTSGMYLEDIVK